MNDIKYDHPLTYHDFFERFNAVSIDCHACPSTMRGVVVGVDIVTDYDGDLMATLGLKAHIWDFYDSSFYWKELNLMSQLAATMPKLRGGISNDQN